MTLEERLSYMKTMLGSDVDVDEETMLTYLNVAKSKILTHRYPYGTKLTEVEPQYEMKMIELAVICYSREGVEGQKSHKENGTDRVYQTEQEILASIPRVAGLPL